MTSRSVLTGLTAIVVALLVVTSLAGAQQQSVADPDLTLQRPGEDPDATEVSVRLSELTHADSDLVFLGTTADFADSMSSAVLQSQGPLLLVEDGLPLSPRVLSELARLDARQVVLLGGESVLGGDVEAEIQRLGYATQRLAGATRIETAIAVARTVPATTAILVRGFGDADPTRAWVDSVTAGALAAQAGLPILFTEQDVLTGATRQYITEAGIDAVLVVGGHAAVAASVQQELLSMGLIVDRVAGGNRAETAVAVASARGLNRPAAISRVVLTDGSSPDGWVGGLVAAGHAAATGAPILVTAGEAIPPETAAVLDETAPALSCLVSYAMCDAARSLSQAPERPTFSYSPQVGSIVQEDSMAAVFVHDPQRLLTGEVELSGECGEAEPEGAPTEGPSEEPTEPVIEGMLQDGVFEFVINLLQDEEPEGDPGGFAQETPTEGPTETPTEPGGTPITSEIESGSCLVDLSFARRGDAPPVVERVVFVVDHVEADFRVTSVPNRAGSPVTFLSTSIGVIDEWHWNFGDGTSSSLQDPDHTYDRPGVYTVSLTVGAATSSKTDTFIRELIIE
ncbi:MAG TPA: cell wall-binding repeat-containing protein [Euzebya sp.]|nr:cell wall-binding repeat-containing protein [Euzebya sp.]